MKAADRLRYHGAAVAYALLAHGLGRGGLFAASAAVKLGATLLLAHAMTIAAYLVHEAARNTILRSARHNERLGRVSR